MKHAILLALCFAFLVALSKGASSSSRSTESSSSKPALVSTTKTPMETTTTASVETTTMTPAETTTMAPAETATKTSVETTMKTTESSPSSKTPMIQSTLMRPNNGNGAGSCNTIRCYQSLGSPTALQEDSRCCPTYDHICFSAKNDQGLYTQDCIDQQSCQDQVNAEVSCCNENLCNAALKAIPSGQMKLLLTAAFSSIVLHFSSC